MARLTTADDIPSGPASVGDTRPSIWSAIHPRLLELIRAHRSTLIFVNSRRLAERLAGALNELAGETLVRSHHGSIARRAARRDRGSAEGRRAARARRHLVARARHRHGRDRSRRPDRGAAVGRQRPAAHRPRRPPGRRGQRRRDLSEVPRRSRRVRRGRQGDARRRGRSDPLSAQPARHRRAADRRDDVDGRVGRRRAVRHDPPRRAVRRAEPRGRSTACSTCCRAAIRPTSSPSCGRASPGIASPARSSRAKARSASRSPTAARFPTAACSACSSLGAGPGAARVGELDEEMVFESRVGETFVLGASSWRIEEITHDRVLVSPAPGRAGQDAVLERRPRRAGRSSSGSRSAG